ncbi:MAG: flavodoxin [Anaerolineae bacterium]|jgi:flavodoxin
MAGEALIVYYSRSGNTRRIAMLVHQEMGGTLHEIEPEAPYPRSYDATVDQAKKEIEAGHRPALESTLDSVESYNTIFVGSPNWWSTIAPPVASFLSECDMSEKIMGIERQKPSPTRRLSY